MKKLGQTLLIVTSLMSFGAAGSSLANEGVTKYFGDCDASTAIAHGDKQFLEIGDENSIARLYDIGGQKVAEGSLEPILKLPKDTENEKKLEADLEASALLGKWIYVMSSQGRDNHGKYFKARHQFAAFTYSVSGDKLVISGHGKSYTHLVKDLLSDKRYDKYKLEDPDVKKDADLAPKSDGSIGVEGLAAGLDGKSLFIGCRSPLFKGRALVIPLLNPEEIVTSDGATAKFGNPVELDLDGLGIRSIEYWPENKTYLIVAGHVDTKKGFKIYSWSGLAGAIPKLLLDQSKSMFSTPEAIVLYHGNAKKYLLLSDCGRQDVGGTECKDLPAEQKFFEGRWFDY